MNTRGWTWTKDEEERSDYDEGRLDCLASRWSELHNAAEQRMFSRMSDDEEGRYDYDQEPCEHCSDGLQGVEFEGGPKAFLCCVSCRQTEWLTGITCAWCGGDGFDHADERAAVKEQAARDAEIEVVEGMLHALGARMMRPYEHWNEDEKYMEYMERER